MSKVVAGTSGFPAPQIDLPPTPAGDPHVQALVAENASLHAERDQLAAINARLQYKLDIMHKGMDVLVKQIKEKE